MLAQTVISSVSNTYTKEEKSNGIGELPDSQLKMVISINSNTWVIPG
jgi:hypothetical protein